jgi:hypothetical protein
VNRDEANDAAALAVFTAARDRGQPVTMALVRDVLDRMADREVAGKARPAEVFFTVRAWQSSIAATRRRAGR